MVNYTELCTQNIEDQSQSVHYLCRQLPFDQGAHAEIQYHFQKDSKRYNQILNYG